MTAKALTLLGFAAKAGKLSYGMDMSIDAVKNKKAKLIVCAADISVKSHKEIKFFTTKHNTDSLVIDCNMETLSKAIGHKCGILSVNDLGFADAIKTQSAQN